MRSSLQNAWVIFRHEISTGWALPVVILLAETGLAIKLWSPVAGGVSRETRIAVVGVLAVLIGAPLGARRVLAETAAGSFLATRPVSRQAAIYAKAAATLLDVAVACVGLIAIGFAQAFGRQYWAIYWIGFGPVVLATLAAVSFAAYSTLPSRWIAGALCVLAVGVLIGPLDHGEIWDGQLEAVPMRAGIVTFVAVVVTILWGRPSAGGAS